MYNMAEGRDLDGREGRETLISKVQASGAGPREAERPIQDYDYGSRFTPRRHGK
jgi:hypothetical protein